MNLNELRDWLPLLIAILVFGGIFLVLLLGLGLSGKRTENRSTRDETRHKEILKKVRSIELRSRHIVNDVFAGNYHSAFKGQGMEFEEVREYMPGDDIRSIDWNVTARMNQPYIKKFIEERELTIWLVVDVSGSNRFGSRDQLKQDVAAEIAAVLAFAAIKNNDRVGLLLFSEGIEEMVPPDKGVRHVLRVVKDIVNVQPKQKGSNIVPALDFLNKASKRHAIVFVISDFMFTGNYQRLLGLTGRHHDTVAIVLGDRHEQSWPRVGLVEWEDQETGDRVLVDTHDKRTRRRFTRLQAERRGILLADLHRMGIDTIEISASEPYEKPFLKFFRMRNQRMGR